jgi:hypothetical protein
VKPNEPYLDLPEPGDLSTEQLDLQVQKAQEQLLQLKRQQDLIEKQKRELEELSRRQDQLYQGKMEMVEKLSRATVILERETFEAQKRVEMLRDIHEMFSQHLNVLESINPKDWDGSDMNRELGKALSAVDDARAEYNKSLPKFHTEDSTEPRRGDTAQEDPTHEAGFGYWLKAGLAFTLPLLILGSLFLVAYLLR